MDSEEATSELKVLRQLMERPIRFSTMSGLSGVLAGSAALAGCAVEAWLAKAWFGGEIGGLHMAVWAGVFVAAFVAACALTRLREVRQGMPLWSNIKRRILLTVLPPFAASAGLTAIIVVGEWQWGGGQASLIPAIWMILYGLALWQLGEFTPIEVRLLGAAFLVGGLITAAWGQQCPQLSMGMAFGGLHIVYGAIVWVRHGG